MNAVEVTGLTKRFRDKLAVNGISLSVKKGEILALLGVNGAGKTTTINILTGLLSPESGDVKILSCPLSKLREIKKKINVSTQESAVSPSLTVIENLTFMCGIYGLDKKEAKKRVDRLIDEFNMKEFEKRRAKRLSGGELRRLSIAMALVNEPELLFLDEPTIGVDVLSRRELHRSIKALKGKTTVILTTHYIEEAEELADNVFVMSKGRSVAEGSPAELIKRVGASSLEEAFVTLVESYEKEFSI